MRRGMSWRCLASFAAAALSTAGMLGDLAATAAQPAATKELAPGEFAPGVLTVVEPVLDRADAISIHDVVEIRADKSLKWEPNTTTPSRTLFEMAHNAAFPQQAWGLEFAFKPLRMIEVDVPQPNGKLARKQIWYLVYRVRNTGAALAPKVLPDGNFETKAVTGGEVRFQPHFVLVSRDQNQQGEPDRKAYLDRIIPAAIEAIRQREFPDGELLNSAQLATELLPVESGRTQRGKWGVAMWQDIDPQMDFFSIFVGGLTNAYQWTDSPGAYKTGDAPGTGRQFARKVLQLNFWRPGDEIDQNEREIRLGTAPGKAGLYDSVEGVAYRWVYR